MEPPKPHARQFFLAIGISADHWPEDIGVGDTYASTFCSQLKELKGIAPYTSMVQAIEHPTMDEYGSPIDASEVCDIWVMPDAVQYRRVKRSDIGDFLKLVLTGQDSNTFKSEPLERSNYVFVCAHKLRDNRCSIAANYLVPELEEAARERNIEVEIVRCSHVGGHKWAGNAILFPSGIWLGRVQPCDAGSVIESFTSGQIPEHLKRGQIELRADVPRGQSGKCKFADW